MNNSDLKKNTTQQVSRIVERTLEEFNKGEKTGAVMLDVSKAFDRVWHKSLLYKLNQFKMPITTIKLLNSYLTKRTFEVKINNETSSKRITKAGVLQGSVLAPLLYNIYTSDLPRTENTNSAIFADDRCLYTTSQLPNYIIKKLQEHLKLIEEWALKWRIESIIFKHNRKEVKTAKTTKMHIANQQIKCLSNKLEKTLKQDKITIFFITKIV